MFPKGGLTQFTIVMATDLGDFSIVFHSFEAVSRGKFRVTKGGRGKNIYGNTLFVFCSQLEAVVSR